jgi:hypothetical protein
LGSGAKRIMPRALPVAFELKPMYASGRYSFGEEKDMFSPT